MANENPYLALVQDDVTGTLRQSMTAASDKNPDMEATLQALASKAGVPLDAVRLNQPEVQRQVDAQSLDYAELAKRLPTTAAFLSEQNNAAVARDDVESLSFLEDSLNFGANFVRSVVASAPSAGAGLYGVAQAGAELAATVASPLVGTILPENPFGRMAESMKRQRANAEAVAKSAEGDQAGMGFVQKSALSGAKSLGQNLLMMPASVLSGSPLPMLTGMTATTGGQSYGQARDAGVSVPGSLIFGSSQASIEYATEMFPAINLLRDMGLKSSAKKMLINQVMTEVPGEQVATVFQDMNEWAVLNPAKPFSEYLAERPSAAAQTLIATLVSTGGQVGVTQAINRAANGAREKQAVDILTALKDGVMDSKTFERAPERVKQFIAQHVKNGPLENVFIPADQLSTYFQTINIDPAAAAAEMGATNYQEAVATGGDVIIPLAEFIGNVAKTEHYDALLQDIRFTQGEMTARERDLFEKNHPDEVAQMVADAANFELPQEQPALAQMRDDIAGQLIGGGMERTTAEQYAKMYAGTMANLAERSGQDPLALHQQYGLQVARQMPDILTKLGTSDIQIDPLLDMLRSGAGPTDQQINGPSLIEFIRSIGGINDAGGELRQMEVDRDKAPFVKNIAQLTGRSVDEVAALANEAGYMVGDLLDAIEQEIAGNPTYSANNANEEALGRSRDLNNLAEYLNSIGVDLATASNDDVRKAMAAAIGNVYGQAAPQTVGDFTAGIEARYPGVKLDLFGSGDKLTLSRIVVPKDGRGAGTGSAIMQAIIDFADANGKTVSPTPAADFGGTVSRLKHFYKRFGFVENKGKNKDFTISESMYREPEKTTLNQPDDGGMSDRRGYIQFGANRKFSIALLERANLSTFLHETGHFWLEVMGDLAADPNSSQQMRDDYAATLKFLGVDSREKIGMEQHELFARANEAYLREGKSPSPEMRAMFQKFKSWLMMIYKSLSDLNVTLNDEVRGVFDRIYASDAEIEAARHEVDVSALLSTAQDVGLSDAEFVLYRKSIEGEVLRAKEKLAAKLMHQFEREKLKWWNDELAKTTEQVAAEVDAMPDQQAFAALVDGALPDGTAIKLDKAELVEKYGKEYIKRLPRGKAATYSNKGDGWGAQDAAEVFGFKTADDLVQALVNMRPRKDLIAAEARQRMVDLHGDILTDGTITAEVDAAMHNDEKADRLAFELKLLRRKQREVKPHINNAMKEDKQAARAATDVPPVSAFRDAARGIIGQTLVRDARPYQYLLAERKASKAAFKAMANKDYLVAANEKQRELLNHYLYLEATKAVEQADNVVDHMGKLGKTAAQQRIGKAGHDYLDQINGLMEQYEFKRVGLRTIDRRKSLMEWYQEQVDNGFEPVIDADLLARAGTVNYKELQFDQLFALDDAVTSIEHLAKLKNKLLANRKGIERDQAISELVAIAEESNAKVIRPYDLEQRTAGEKVSDWFAAKDRAMLNVRTLVKWLDGGKADGPWHTMLFNPASEAQTAQLDLMKSIGKPVDELMDAFLSDGDRMRDKFNTQLGVVSRKFLMSIAFNMGSASSFDKMIKGGPGKRVDGAARVQWNESTIQDMVANLDAKDWNFIQGIWTILDTKMYPKINEMTKRVSGVPLSKVEAKPFMVTTRDGQTLSLDGGYYPLKYDPQYSQAGLKQDSGPLAGLTEAGYSSATTPRGHTKARAEGYAAPLMFDFTHILQSHLAGSIKDLTHREFLMDAQGLLRDDRIRAVLQERLGAEYEGEFMSWLKRIANDGNAAPAGSLTFIDKFAEASRTNATIVMLGYKVTTVLAQSAGIFNAMEHPNVGAGWFARGLNEATRSPAASYALVTEKSGEMRHRFDTIDQSVREVLQKGTHKGAYGKTKDAINRSAFIGINIADRLVTIPTWLGAYRKAVSGGMAEDDAVHAADDAVVGSQGAGGAKDINSIQAARGAVKLFTMFFTPFAAQYARLRSVGRAAGQKGWRYTPEAVMRVAMLTFLPAVMADLVTARGPSKCAPDDPECPLKWLAIKMATSVTATIPGVREAGNALEMYVMGGQQGVKISPLVGALDKVSKTTIQSFEIAFGDREFDSKFAWNVFDSAGYVVGLPTGQAHITGEYLADLLTDKADPEGPGEFMRDLMFRRPKKE
jgi:GNAT superfamily N-acetyltransferase